MTTNGPWSELRNPRKPIAESDFRASLGSQAHDFQLLANGFLEQTPEQWTQRQLQHLCQVSDSLETFLDDHGARENKTFFPARELVAFSRWLALAMSGVVHLHSRAASYALSDPEWVEEQLLPLSRKAALNLGGALLRTLEGIRGFWGDQGMPWPNGATRMEALSAFGAKTRLPRDLMAVRSEYDDGSVAASMAGRLLNLVQPLQENPPRKVEGREQLAEVVQRYCREEQCRRFEGRVHNLQSAYDNLVRGSVEEKKMPEIRQIRGAASLALHLFEAATALSHLAGRHRLDQFLAADGKPVVSQELIHEILVNYCVLGAYRALEKAIPCAKKVLERFTEAQQVELHLPDSVTLHARPLTLIVKVVNHYRVPVEASIGGNSCPANSMMQLLVLAGSNPEARSMVFSGDRRVLEDLELLFEASLGEEGLDRLPKGLGYLTPA